MVFENKVLIVYLCCSYVDNFIRLLSFIVNSLKKIGERYQKCAYIRKENTESDFKYTY